MVGKLLFALAIISLSVKCNPICDLEGVTCMTDVAKLLFVKFMIGELGVDASDPLHLELIEVDLPALNYKISDAVLTGLKDCDLDLSRTVYFVEARRRNVQCNAASCFHNVICSMYKDNQTYNYFMACPHLTVESEYEINGDVGPEYVEGKGNSKVDYYHYYFRVHGSYEKVEAESGNVHVVLTTLILDVEPKDKVQFEYKNLYNGDAEKSEKFHKFANENWQLMDNMISPPIMEKFIHKLNGNINEFLDIVPLKDLRTFKAEK